MTKKSNNNSDEGIKITDADEETEGELTVDGLIGKLAALQKSAEAERARADEMKDMAQRLQAEFDNYRKRNLDSAKKVREDVAAEILSKVVSSVDVCETALAMIADENVKKGVAMIRDEMIKLLSSYGVEEIEAAGKPFDPKYHEAVMQAPADSDEARDTVKDVFQKGYKMGERVLRPARVTVNK